MAGVRVRLVAVGPEDELVEAALRLSTSPEQARFALVPAQSFPLALADPARTAFVVLDDGEAGSHEDDGVPTGRVVGAGVLDTAAPGSDAELAGLLTAAGHDPTRAVLLRSFVIGSGHQGRGLGTQAARAARALAQRLAAGADVVVLTVNEQNAPGLRAYPRAGFTDVGRDLGGDAGPQRAMVARCG